MRAAVGYLEARLYVDDEAAVDANVPNFVGLLLRGLCATVRAAAAATTAAQFCRRPLVGDALLLGRHYLLLSRHRPAGAYPLRRRGRAASG